MSINRYKAGSDGVRQNPRRNEIPWQMNSSPLYIRRQDHLNDRMRALYVSEPTTPPPPPPVTFTSPTTRQTPLAGRNHHYLQRQDPRNSSDYDNTPPEPPKRTSSASMTASYDSASTSSSSLQYRNGGGGGGYGAGSSSRSNDGLYASPGAPALAPLAVEEYVCFLIVFFDQLHNSYDEPWQHCIKSVTTCASLSPKELGLCAS